MIDASQQRPLCCDLSEMLAYPYCNAINHLFYFNVDIVAIRITFKNICSYMVL